MRSFLDRICGPQRRQDGRTYSTPGDQIRYEDLAAAYLSADRDHADDIIQAIGSSTAAPRTVHMRVAVTLEFLAHHGAQTSDRDRRQTRQKQPIGGPISKRGELSHEVIRNIVGRMDEHG